MNSGSLATPPESDDAPLVARLQAGEEAAYETLVAEYGGRLWQVCRRFFHDDSDAADALQDAFLAAFRGIDRFDGNSKLGTWLHRVTVNACLMKLRSRQRHPERPISELLPSYKDDGRGTEPVAPWTASAPALMQQQETRQLVHAAIQQLPESYRTVLLLRDIEELDTHDTAELLEVSENVVKTRLHRARQALRTLLDPHFRGAAL